MGMRRHGGQRIQGGGRLFIHLVRGLHREPKLMLASGIVSYRSRSRLQQYCVVVIADLLHTLHSPSPLRVKIPAMLSPDSEIIRWTQEISGSYIREYLYGAAR